MTIISSFSNIIGKFFLCLVLILFFEIIKLSPLNNLKSNWETGAPSIEINLLESNFLALFRL